MAEILHQFIGSLSHYIFIGFQHHPRWCKISAINSIGLGGSSPAIPQKWDWDTQKVHGANQLDLAKPSSSHSTLANSLGACFSSPEKWWVFGSREFSRLQCPKHFGVEEITKKMMPRCMFFCFATQFQVIGANIS